MYCESILAAILDCDCEWRDLWGFSTVGRKGTNELISGEKPFIAILSNLKCLFTRLVGPIIKKKDKNVYDSVLTSTCCRRFESDLANGETFFFGRQSKHENLTMLSVYPLNLNMVRKFRRKSVQCSVRPIKKSILVITASERCSLNGDDHLSNCHNNVAFAI